ncbi:dTMP kinase [Streptomyces sp. SceaMP-e96]|uniref:dTMP kinase n=1 Tax=unclassified Streptomyces TaxID=2593676 RepID=UPI0008239B3F|nr:MULTISPECIES: dTMP kinase [unclassified Streptomyces]MYT12359.1 dTMP kinase [Streptomyces sp. SID4951]SCK29290.1 dTMP kinase [Streptomyces sp. SceaMP-e96]
MTRAEQPTVVTPTSGALAADSRERAVRALLRFPPLKRLWSAQFVGGIGDALSMLVLVLLALQAALYVPLGGEAVFGGGYRGAALAVTAVFAARMLAMLLFGAVLLGPLSALTAPAGSLDRRWTMIGADVLRLALLVIAPLWIDWTPDDALAWLLVTVFVTGVAERFWTVARESAAPGLLPTPPPEGAAVRPLPDNMDALRRLSLRTAFVSLPIAAAALVVVTLISKLLGTGIDWFHLHQAALGSYVAAGLFAASVSILYFIELPGVPTPRPRSPLEGLRRPKAAGAKTGQPAQGEKPEDGTARPAVDKGRTGAIPLLVAACAAVAAALAAAVSLAVLHGYDLAGGPAAFALLVLALTGGTAVGIRGAQRVLPTLSRRRLLALAVAATGLALLAMGLVPDPTTVLVLALLAGISAGIAANTGHVLLDQESEESRTARTTEHLHAVVRLSIALAAIVAPLLAAVIGPHHVGDGPFSFAYGGAAYTLMLAGALLLPVAALVLGKVDDRQGVPLRRDLREALRGGDPAQAPAPTGFFIALEGGDGAGKSTQVEALAEWIRGKGHEVVVTREPGATAIGKRLRSIILDVSTSGLSDRAEALMFAADRAEHVNSVIRPALERGAVVITDRYIDSSVAYQGAGRNLDPTEIARISRWATDGLVPHLTVLLDISPETARERFTEAPDRLESEPAEFHQRVRAGFLTLAAADPARYLVVDAGQEPEAVTTVVRHRLDQVLPLSETELQAQAEARKAAEEEARRKAEEEAARKAEEERLERERQEQLARLRAEEEERKRQEAEAARAREEARRAEEARKRAEEARQAAEAERARREAEERARQAEQERLRKQHEEEARLRKEAEERRLEKQRKAEAALVRAEEARKAAAEAAAAAEAKAAAEAAEAAKAADAPTAETYVADLRKRFGESAPDDASSSSGSGSDSERTEESLPRPGTPGGDVPRAADETAVLPPVRDAQDPWRGLDTGADVEETAVLPPVRGDVRGDDGRSGDPADRVPPWMFRKETPDAAAGGNGAASGQRSAPAESRVERTRELPQIDPVTGHPVEIPQRSRPRPEWAEETPLDDLPTLADELLGPRGDEEADDGRGEDGRRGGQGRRG